ncbi:hypothetical protein [Mycobacterium lacus]|uniref:Uncharacterized protein n=1 Tax=Mycobacterium lacus TaxID=169765 RepID=A0A7I7NMW1_9MYCO|nr:hypothetical protein [Mycobacterium lacus]MCV7121911.1 hypothetical protein [Mycobacterium lacus]BBX97986.1 hypothetical protein MLAC_32800 [Mycobacterium lacus]
MKYLIRIVSALARNDEAGALSPVHRNRPQSRQYRPKRYSFLEDSSTARAMERL